MLIKVANDFAVDPETVDAVKASEVDGVSLVWFNGQDFPYRASADYETVTLRLERKSRLSVKKFWNTCLTS